MTRPSRLLLAALILCSTACEREERRLSNLAPMSSRPGTLQANTAQPPISFAGQDPNENNAWAVAQGQRLFRWYNCNGCHSNGGGGMGPPLMDNKWIYGNTPQDIYTTIVNGRPNGMPAFGKRIPESQVWQLVAYVRSLSGLLRKDVRPSRSDHMTVRHAPSSTTPRSANPNAPGSVQPSR